MSAKAIPLFRTLPAQVRPAFSVAKSANLPQLSEAEQALQRERAEIAQLKTQYTAAIQRLSATRESVVKETMGELRELVFAVGRELAMKDLQADASTVEQLLSDLLTNLGGGRGFEVKMSPDDASRVQLGDGAEVLIKADETLLPGSCVITRADVSIDASFASRERQVRETMGLQ